jgi:hypothetical protein
MHKLCARRRSISSMTPSGMFLSSQIALDADFCFGMSASLKHFGFNVSPPPRF